MRSASSRLGTKSFRSFMLDTLQGCGVVDLSTLAPHSRAQTKAAAGNVKYINEQRGSLREMLRAAAREGVLPFTEEEARGRVSAPDHASLEGVCEDFEWDSGAAW